MNRTTTPTVPQVFRGDPGNWPHQFFARAGELWQADFSVAAACLARASLERHLLVLCARTPGVRQLSGRRGAVEYVDALFTRRVIDHPGRAYLSNLFTIGNRAAHGQLVTVESIGHLLAQVEQILDGRAVHL